MKYLFIIIIKAYRLFISPLKKPCCRFEPSCSVYALHAFQRYGTVKGLYLSAKRRAKCHPFHKGGYDPVP
ncbi:MAG: membrane protein insertion efficiency factor YidD [Clostridiaceae bacterium]|nr:membrane protein insertion efficiency factor YidD [Clostridiaceae bacterium]